MFAVFVLVGLGGPSPVRAADPEEYILENGLRVRLVPSPGDKQAIVLLAVQAGFMEEPAGSPHVAHVTEHMVVFDLPPKEAKVVKEWARSNKANGETLPDLMYFDLNVAPDEVDLALRIQAARLAPLEFSRETLAREIPRTLEEVDFVERSKFPAAGKFAFAPFVQAALHGKTDLPIRARTRKISVEDVQAFHRRTFRTDRATLVVVGDFDSVAVRKTIDAGFGKLEKSADARVARAALKPGDRTADWDVSTEHLFVSWPIPDAGHDDHPALTLASLALLARLPSDFAIRALGDAQPQLNVIDGALVIGVQAKPKADLGDLKAKVLDRVAALAKPDDLKAGDVDQLRKSLIQMHMTDVDLDKIPLTMRVTKTMARANLEIQRLMKTLAWSDWNAYRKRIEAVKPEAVREVIGKYLVPKLASVVRIQSVKGAK